MNDANNDQTKRVIKLVVTTVLLLVALMAYFYTHQKLTNNSSTQTSGENITMSTDQALQEMEKTLETNEQGLSNATVVMQTTRGKIKYKFYSKDAPKTVRRMYELIQKGFYNNLTFHRVIPGFVAQGGDPTGTGMGGTGQKQQAEFNSRKHVVGTVSMARAQDPNSADSQFYIMLGVHPHLDGQYTVFGQLIEGQEAANQLQVGDRMTSVTIE